jgi:hypothetical protein
MLVADRSLIYVKYQRAVAGLVFAMTRRWHLDLRGHEFDEIDAIYRAVLGSTSLLSLNKLTVRNDESSNLASSVQRDSTDR